MLKFLHLLKEQEGNKPLAKIEHKILKLLSKKFLSNGEYDRDDEDLYNDVSDYLKNKLLLSPEQILPLYYLLNNNMEYIGSEDDSWTKNPKRGYDSEGHYTGENEEIIGELLNTPPNFIVDSDHGYYAMDQYFVEVIGDHYAIGTYRQVKESLIELVDDMLYGLNSNSSIGDWFDSELYHIHGESYIIENMYIPENMKETIADEEARLMIEEDYGDDEDLLNQLEEHRPDMGNEWSNLEERKYDLETSLGGDDDDIIYEKIGEVDKEISELAEQAKEIIYEEEYQSALVRMSDPLDFLWEHGYIEKEGRGWSIGRHDYRDRSPINEVSWVKVNIDKIKKELTARSIEYRVDDLSRMDGIEHQVEHKGETYYIYKTE